ELDDVAARDGDCALHQPFQLADVTGPVVGHQGIGRRGRETPFAAHAVAFQKIVRELENVGAPLAECRYAHVDTAQAVEQVRAKATSLDEFGQPPVGCRDDSNVDA